MSTFEVRVVPFQLDKHPNADTLSIATIRGWQCVVKTADFVDEKFGVYVPLDAIADKDHTLLSFMEGKKVKTIRLRQVISQGILLPYTKVENYLTARGIVFADNEDLKDVLGIKKFVPPPPPNRGTSVPDFMSVELPPLMQRYTEIENIKNFLDVIKPGEQVRITEKLHGTSARYGLIDGKFYIGSRNRGLRTENFTSHAGDLIEIKKSTWHEVAERQHIIDTLQCISSATGNNVVLFGEIVGQGIQDLTYGHSTPVFYAYDLGIEDKQSGNMMYAEPVEFKALIERYSTGLIPVVPELKVGEFTPEDIKLKDGRSTISDHIREGIVIEPMIPRYDYTLGRVKLKAIGEEYLMRKGGTDYEG